MSLLARHRAKLADARLPAPTLAQAPAVISQSEHQAALFALKKEHLVEFDRAAAAAKAELDKANAEKAKLQSKLDEATKALEELDKANAEKAKKPEPKPSK